MPFLAGKEFLVNTTTFSGQSRPSVAALDNGTFMIAWADSSLTGADTSESAVRGQVFSKTGSKIGSELLVNTTYTSFQSSPDVTTNNGKFAVSWTDNSHADSDSAFGVRGRIVGANGAGAGNDFVIPTTRLDSQQDSVSAELKNGNFIVVWLDASPVADFQDTDVRAQIFNGSTKVGGEFLVNGAQAGHQAPGDVVGLSNGGFAITWYEGGISSANNFAEKVYVQAYNSDGSKNGTAKLVANSTFYNTDPHIASLSGGRFMVIWHTNAPSGGTDIHGQIFTSNGTKSGNEFTINSTLAQSQNNASVTELSDGRVVVVWSDLNAHGADVSGNSVRGQILTNTGVKSGKEFLINQTTAGTQYYPDVAALDAGRFVVAFEDANSTNILARTFDSKVYTGDNGKDVVYGGSLADKIVGKGGNDVFSGSAGNDLLIGGTGADRLLGGSGSDTASYVTSAAKVTVNLARTTAQISTGEASGDILSSIEKLVGSRFADTLTGNAGNNTFTGGAGADRIAGGVGSDTANYSSSAAGVTVNLARTAGQISTGDAAGDILNGIENVTGSARADRLTGNGAGNIISGGGGDDLLTGALGNDTFIFGKGFGKDTISDFEEGASGGDVVRIRFGAAIDTFAELLAAAQQSGDDTVITFDANTTLTLVNVQKTALDSGDFLFG